MRYACLKHTPSQESAKEGNRKYKSTIGQIFKNVNATFGRGEGRKGEKEEEEEENHVDVGIGID